MEAMKILMTWPEKSQNLAMWHSAKSLRLIQGRRLDSIRGGAQPF